MDKDKSSKVKERNTLKARTRGELIAAIRRKLGYTQEELEWRSGVSKTQISRIERDCTTPGIETIKKLEEALDVPLIDLFLNPDEVDQESIMQVKQPGTVLSQFEKKLAKKQLSPKELQSILNTALIEAERRTKRPSGSGEIREKPTEDSASEGNEEQKTEKM